VLCLNDIARETVLDAVHTEIERHSASVQAEYLSRLYVAHVRNRGAL